MRKTWYLKLQVVSYLMQLILVTPIFLLLWLMPYKTSSRLVGSLFAFIGPYLKASEVVRKNLIEQMPHLTRSEKTLLLHDIWRNLGNVVGEFPHIHNKKLLSQIKISGLEILEQLSSDKRGAILFSAHYGNWEIIHAKFGDIKFDYSAIYRKSNNPYFDWLVNRIRNCDLVPKGSAGARALLTRIKHGKHLMMLVDQRQINGGVNVPFLNSQAMTASAIASLTLKHNLPLVPVRVLRNETDSHRLTIEILPPLEIDYTNNDKTNQIKILTKVNHLIGEWIMERPDHWFWVHDRWRG